jgi:hypothetical protein
MDRLAFSSERLAPRAGVDKLPAADKVAHRQLLSRILETGEWEVYAPEKFRQVGFLLVLSGSSLMIISLALADTGKGR